MSRRQGKGLGFRRLVGELAREKEDRMCEKKIGGEIPDGCSQHAAMAPDHDKIYPTAIHANERQSRDSPSHILSFLVRSPIIHVLYEPQLVLYIPHCK